jgi:ABC-2 type transport system permease protein
MTTLTTDLSLSRTTGLARYNALLLTRNRMAMLYGVVVPLAPLALLLSTPSGSGAAAIATTLTMAALFPVYYNVLSQFVNRRDELVLKRLRTGEIRDAELLASIALPGAALAVGVMLVAVPVAVALGEPVPLNPVVYAATVLLTVVLFASFAFWTAAWTRTAEAAQLTSAPVIALAVFGQMTVAFPESVQRWTDLTPGAAMTNLVRGGWFGFGEPGTERTLDFADTWTAAGKPLLVLVAWAALAAWLAARSLHWEPRT